MDMDRIGGGGESSSENVLMGSGSETELPPAMRLQILTTEHWSLLSTRAMSWNEAFSRATMFLSVLSGAVVALALVAQVTSFGEAFLTFACSSCRSCCSSGSRRSCVSCKSITRMCAGSSA